MLGLLRRLLLTVFGEYTVFRILHKRLNALDDAAPLDERCQVVSMPGDVQHRDGYAGDGAYGFAVIDAGIALCTCWVWFGERYRTRNYWPLEHAQGKVIALETQPQARGQGLAVALLNYIARALAERGFTDLYARVWHSNKASIRAFHKAGWISHALVIEFDLLGKRRRIVLRTRR